MKSDSYFDGANPIHQDEVKIAAHINPEQTPGFRLGEVEGLIFDHPLFSPLSL